MSAPPRLLIADDDPVALALLAEVLTGERYEVRSAAGALLTVPGTRTRNPAFDVTPAALVTALVTERGIMRPPLRP